MFHKREDDELMRLQQELLAEEEYPEEEWADEELDLEAYSEAESDEDNPVYFDEEDMQDEEAYAPEVYSDHPVHRYGKGSPKTFDDEDFFADDIEDEDVLYREDYKKAKKKKRRQNLGLVILAICEIIAIAAIAIWWATWML